MPRPEDVGRPGRSSESFFSHFSSPLRFVGSKSEGLQHGGLMGEGRQSGGGERKGRGEVWGRRRRMEVLEVPRQVF